MQKIIRHIILLSFFITACVPQSTPQKHSSQSPPESISHKFVDLKIDKATADNGELLYERNCKFCHQKDAIGKPGVAPSLTNKELLSVASNRYLVNTILEGRSGTGMPPFSHLGKEKAMAIVAYLRRFEKLPSRISMVETAAKARGDVNKGKALYQSICLSCHGPKGNGYRSGGTGTAIGMKGFLSKASDGFIRTTIKEGRSETRMRGFSGPEGLANLNNQQIDDIIVYLRNISH